MNNQEKQSARKILSRLGKALLWVVGLALTVGAGAAISNGRSWIDLVAGSGAFGWVANPQIRIYLVAATFFVLGWTVHSWWSKRRRKPPQTGPSAYDLFARMDTLADRIKDYLQHEPDALLQTENPYELATDCYSFNTTLQKAGFVVPDVSKLKLRDRLAVFAYFYLNVGPFLRDGHVTEAKGIAADLGPKAISQIQGNI